MNLDQVKTGDRLWTMRIDETSPLSNLILCEVIHLEHLKSPKNAACFTPEGRLMGASRCALVSSGEVVDITSDRVHLTKEGALNQAIKELDVALESISSQRSHYQNMLNKPPA